MIPKIIHQIWIGDKQLPETWLNSWKDKHPEYEYILWTEKDIDELNLVNRHIYDKFNESKTYNGMANVARIEILYNYGGIYLDADLKCLKPLNKEWLKCDFVGVESPHKKGRILNGILMTESYHYLLKQYMDVLGKVKEIHPSWKNTGSGIMTPILEGKIKLLPSWTFLPIDMRGKKINYDKAYAVHHYGTTFKRY